MADRIKITEMRKYCVDNNLGDDLWYVFGYGVPIAHFKSEKKARTVAHLLNIEYENTLKLKKEIYTLRMQDEDRKAYQRTLEAKIRRLKDRIRVLEK